MKFALIGKPVSHSRSPQMHQAAYDALGLDHTFEAILVEPGTVSATFDRLAAEGYRGVNITMPHKEESLQWCEANDLSRRARAVNTVDLTTRKGINTDGPGFVEALKENTVTGPILLLGAGGSSRALAIAMVDAGYDLTIWNRTPERAQELAGLSGARWSGQPTVDGFAAVVNATSSSINQISLPLEGTQREGLAIDLYYSSESTTFMLDMADRGWSTLDGRSLLVAQGALAFEFWLGIPAPRSAMKKALGL